MNQELFYLTACHKFTTSINYFTALDNKEEVHTSFIYFKAIESPYSKKRGYDLWYFLTSQLSFSYLHFTQQLHLGCIKLSQRNRVFYAKQSLPKFHHFLVNFSNDYLILSSFRLFFIFSSNNFCLFLTFIYMMCIKFGFVCFSFDLWPWSDLSMYT